MNKKKNKLLEEQPFVYKGYTASINYCRQDNIFCGKIEGIIPIIDFRGTSITELEKEFHMKVDSYLQDCEKTGMEPCKQYSGVLNLNIKPEIHARIAYMCEKFDLDPDQFIKDSVMSSLRLLEFTDTKSEEEDGAEETVKIDMYDEFNENYNHIKEQINSLGKVFFYRNIGAEIMFCDEDYWEGRLLYLPDEYTFVADSLEKLYGAFITTVDEYYEECEIQGRKPDIHYDGKLCIEVPPLLDYLLDIIADIENEDVDTVLKFFNSTAIKVLIRNMENNEKTFESFKQMLGVI